MDFDALVIYQGKQVLVRDLIEEGIIKESYYVRLLEFHLTSQEVLDLILMINETISKNNSFFSILKKLGIPSQYYYKLKKMGMSNLQAFEYCIMELKRYKKPGISKISKVINIAYSSLYRNIVNEGLTEKEAITRIRLNQAQKQYQKGENIRLGLEEGVSIEKYCYDHKMNYRTFLYLIQKGMNVEEATVAYYTNTPHYKPSRFEFWGIPLKSICLKYSLNYDRYSKLLRQGVSNLEAMRIALINSFSFQPKEKNLIKQNWELIHCVPLNRFYEIRTILNLSDTFYEQLFLFKQKYERIREDFTYFELHYLIEKKWPVLYHDVLQNLQQSSCSYEEYMIGFRKIESQAKEEILSNLALEPSKLKYMYEDLFSDLEYLPKHGVWVYQRRLMN